MRYWTQLATEQFPPSGALRVYGEKVLPALGAVRV